jgi:hypothetical protein
LVAQPVERSGKLAPEQSEVALDAVRSADHYMIRAGDTLCGHDLAGEGAEAALHPVADHGAADLLGHGEADAHPRIIVLAVADQQDEAGRARPKPGIGGKEVRAFLDRA